MITLVLPPVILSSLLEKAGIHIQDSFLGFTSYLHKITKISSNKAMNYTRATQYFLGSHILIGKSMKSSCSVIGSRNMVNFFPFALCDLKI